MEIDYKKAPTSVRLYGSLVYFGKGLAPLFLLIIRLYFGWQLFLKGTGKMLNYSDTITYFSSIDIPAPELLVAIVAIIEALAGILLAVGFLSRLASLLIIAVLAGAYWFAHHAALIAFETDPSLFITQPPYPFLITALTVLSFGPSFLSIDQIIEWRLSKR